MAGLGIADALEKLGFSARRVVGVMGRLPTANVLEKRRFSMLVVSVVE
jgi:hypothetical protein